MLQYTSKKKLSTSKTDGIQGIVNFPEKFEQWLWSNSRKSDGAMTNEAGRQRNRIKVPFTLLAKTNTKFNKDFMFGVEILYDVIESNALHCLK